MQQRPRRVGIVVFDGVTALDVVGPADAFASALIEREGLTRSAYSVLTIGLSRRRCRAESGLSVLPDCTIADAPSLDTLVVPGGRGLREPRTNERVSHWIRARAERVRRLASVCTGIYGVAPSGVLDGRRVTTHWRHAANVARRFPALRVCADELYIKDDRFYTSAGVTAGIDLALALIEEDWGARVALAVARELVVYVRRAGGQDQFSEPLRFQLSAPDRFSELVAYIAAHLDAPLPVELLARRMAISPRQLSRQCRDALGCSPAALVRRMRLDEAKARLLARGSNVELVAESVGFQSADAFRRAFEQRFGINPSAYRARFLARHAASVGPVAARSGARRE